MSVPDNPAVAFPETSLQKRAADHDRFLFQGWKVIRGASFSLLASILGDLSGEPAKAVQGETSGRTVGAAACAGETLFMNPQQTTPRRLHSIARG